MTDEQEPDYAFFQTRPTLSTDQIIYYPTNRLTYQESGRCGRILATIGNTIHRIWLDQLAVIQLPRPPVQHLNI
jgi:hypothetical protein